MMIHDVVLNQRPLKIETHLQLLLRRSEMIVKHSSVPVLRNVHIPEIATL